MIFAPRSASITAFASSWFRMTNFLSSFFVSFALNGSPFLNCASISQYSSGTKQAISPSRSHRKRSATDCTRPADSPSNLFPASAIERMGLT